MEREGSIMDIKLSPGEQEYLLRYARETIAADQEGRPPRYEVKPEANEGADSAFMLRCGAFVSLHKGMALRGCIGRMTSPLLLTDTVREMARSAAFSDPRFPPLHKDELSLCRIEISVLSPLESCADPARIVVGKHGVHLSFHGRTGVFLPQVPEEQGWGLTEYLEQLCRKAGLPTGAYREKGAELSVFTAFVFGE
jgi:uncharacterized protein